MEIRAGHAVNTHDELLRELRIEHAFYRGHAAGQNAHECGTCAIIAKAEGK